MARRPAAGISTTVMARGAAWMFEFSPSSGGAWTETILHAFTNGNDGGTPFGTLIFDAAGNLYGTTDGGGNSP